jgi:hypothetical protein
MARWLIFSLVVAVITGVLTIVWWWVGDLWADEEHQRFQPGETEKNPGATVIRDFNRTDDEPE